MELFFVDAKWDKSLRLSDDALAYFEQKAVKKVALFAAVQFLHLDKVKKQLEEKGITLLTTKAKRTNEVGQILGCDAYHDSYEEYIIGEADALLYVGDGHFHPKALLLAQAGKVMKEVVIYDPFDDKMYLLTEEEVRKQLQKTKSNLLRYLEAETIGLLVTVKPGQQYLRHALELKKQLESEGKKAYIFLDDNVDLRELENYTFVQAWVNTGCPRIGTDDITTIPQPLVNIKDVMDVQQALERLG